MEQQNTGFIDKTGRDSIKGKIKTETNFFLGELESSAQNGFGIYYIGGKNIYAGEFKNGKYEGMGTLVMEDGTVRFGVFRAGDMISDEEYEIKNYLRSKHQSEPNSQNYRRYQSLVSCSFYKIYHRNVCERKSDQ